MRGSCASATLLMAVWLVGCASVGFRAPSSPLEEDLQSWLRNHQAAVTRISLAAAFQERHGGAIAALAQGKFIVNRIQPNGEVATILVAREFEREERTRRGDTMVRSGTSVEIISFSIENDLARFTLRGGHSSIPPTVVIEFRLPTEPSDKTSLAGVLLSLGRIIDFGPAVARLQQLSEDIKRAETTVAVARRALTRAHPRTLERLDGAGELSRAIEVLLRLRGDYASEVGQPNEVDHLRVELDGLQREIAMLEKIVDPKEVRDLAMRLGATYSRILEAERSVQRPTMSLDDWIGKGGIYVELIQEYLATAARLREVGGAPTRQMHVLAEVLRPLEIRLRSARILRSRGCEFEPLSMDKIKALAEASIPEGAIARTIARCGISFEPAESDFQVLRRLGAGDVLLESLSGAPRVEWPILPKLTNLASRGGWLVRELIAGRRPESAPFGWSSLELVLPF